MLDCSSRNGDESKSRELIFAKAILLFASCESWKIRLKLVTLRECCINSSVVSWGCHILYSQSFILSREIVLSRELLLKSRSIFDAETFWIIFESVGRLKDKGLVSIILFVFFASERDFLVYIISR